MGRPTMGAWSAPLHPVKQHLFADQVPETFQYGAFRQQRMPGLPLKNYHGKTCFVNAVVQVLVHNPYVREQGKEHFGQYCQCKSCLMCYLGYCVHSAYGKTAQTELALPAWMLQHGFPMLAAGKKHQQPLSPERQEDAHDLIRQWLDGAQQHLKGRIKAQRTPLEYIFSWVSEDQIECQGCHYQALRYEEDMDLCLPILKGFDQQDSPQIVASIQEALSLYTTKEVMDGDNKFSCPCCSSKNGNQVAHKGFCIYTIPNTLILPLKRFCQHPRESMKTIKVCGQIEYGQELDLKDFLAPNSPEHPDHPNNCRKPNIAQLRLSGVVIHRGGIGEGHYWAYVQDRYGGWWKFDDHRQAQVDVEEVVSHPHAYILWYTRKQPHVVVVDAPEGCAVWPPGSAPPSEPGVAAEEPQTHSGASVTEAAQWLIAAGSAGHVSGSCTDFQIQEIAPEDAGPQAAQVGVVSPSPLPPPSAVPFDIDEWLINNGLVPDRSCKHASVEENASEGGGVQAAQVGAGSSSRLRYQSKPAFDMDAWLTSVGLEPDRPEGMTEIVEVPDVVPAVNPMDAPAVSFMDAPRSTPTTTPDSPPVKTKVPSKATHVETPFEVSQAAPSVMNEESSMVMLGSNLTMTTPMYAPEPHSSNLPEPHPVQAAAASPSVIHVSPLVEVGASTEAPPADASGPLPTATSVAPAVEEGSPLTLEPSPEAPAPEQAPPSAMGHPASQELALAVDPFLPPPFPAALSATPAVAHTPAGAAPRPVVQPASSKAASFVQPQKVTRQLPKQVTKQLPKQTAAKASGASTAKQAAVSGAEPGVDPQAHARIKAVSDRYAQQMAHQQKLQAAAAAEKKRQTGQSAASKTSRNKRPAQPPTPVASPSPQSLNSAAAVVSVSVPQPSSDPVAAASASSAAPAAVRSAKKGKRQGTSKQAQKAVAAATASKAALSGSVAVKAAEREPVEKVTAAAAKQGDIKEAASVSSPAAAAEQKSVNGKAAAAKQGGFTAGKASHSDRIADKAAVSEPVEKVKQAAATDVKTAASVSSGAAAAEQKAVITAGKPATTAGKAATTAGKAVTTAGKAVTTAQKTATANETVATTTEVSSVTKLNTPGGAPITQRAAAGQATSAGAVEATGKKPSTTAVSNVKQTAAHIATADQANKAAGKKPSAGKSAHKAAARKPAGVRLSAVSLSAQSELAAAAREAAARTAQAEGPAAAAEVPSQAASETGTPQRSATVGSEGKVPTGNSAAAATSSQPVVKASVPLQQPAHVSAAVKDTAGSARAAQSGSGQVTIHKAPAAQPPAQQVMSKPATAHTAVKRQAAAQAAQAITQQAAAGKVSSLTAAQKPAHQASAAPAGSQASVPSGVQNLKQAANTAAAQLNGTEQAQKPTTAAPAMAVPPPQQAPKTAAANLDSEPVQVQKPATTVVTAPPAVALQQAASTAAASSRGTKQARKQAKQARKQARKQVSKSTDTAPEHIAPSLQQAVDTADTAAPSSEGTKRAQTPIDTAPAAAVAVQQAAKTAAATLDGTEQAQTPTSTAPAAAVAVQQAAQTAAATLDGSKQAQTPTSTAPAAAAAAVEPLQATNPAADKSSGQKKAAKPTGRATESAAVSAQKRAADTAAKQLNSAGQQTSQSPLAPAAQLPAQAGPSGSVFHYDRMFSAQFKGSHSDSSNTVPRRAEAEASRRELHNQQPPISGRMAADELLSDEQKEEVSSATAAQHHGGDSGLDNSMRESKQPRSWTSKWTGALGGTWRGFKKVAKGVLIAGVLSAACMAIAVEYGLSYAAGDDIIYPS